MNNLIVYLVDIDNVLADFEGYFLKKWKNKYPDLISIPLSKRNTFYLTDQYPIEYKSKIYEIINSKGFYRNLPPFKTEIDALVRLKTKGNIVKITTSPLLSNSYCIQEKLEWIKEYLGEGWIKDLIVIKDKTLIYGNFLIDDKSEVRGQIKPFWKQLLFNKPYNKEVQELERIKSISDLL